jgi:hypothetical protein
LHTFQPFPKYFLRASFNHEADILNTILPSFCILARVINCPADEKSNKALLVAKANRRQNVKKEVDRDARRTAEALEEESCRIKLPVLRKCSAALVSEFAKSKREVSGKKSDSKW